MADTPDRNALEKIAGWATAEPGITAGSDGTLTADGEPPITIEVTADDERVQLIHHHEEKIADPGRVAAVKAAMPKRGSAVQGTVSDDGTSMSVTLTATIYVDGLTRQGFVSSFNELLSAADTAIGSTPSEIVAEEPKAEKAEPAQAQPEQARDTAPTLEVSQVWAPTHRVPDGGLRAWPEPNPALESTANLQARVELSVAERRGDWARVVGSNGWTGWVDARRLVEMSAGAAAAPPAQGGAFPLAALGAIAVGAAAFLPWFDVQGFSINSFDVALPFLWDVNASGDPALGFLVVGLGALALAAMFLPNVPDGLRKLAGVGAVAVAALFTYQLWRGLDQTGADIGDLVDTIGYGVYACLIGGLVLLGASSKSN